MPIPSFPKAKEIVGIGMSDAHLYAKLLARKLCYENTYYDGEPKLDITSIDPKMEKSLDFIICSDVFEHVAPPVQRAFGNLYKLLKRNGVCIFSVPYKKFGSTEEHFPDLYDYRIIKKKGERILLNKTKDGVDQVFDRLRFHGGGGATLEVRVFSIASLLDDIGKAGFVQVKLHDADKPEYGIIWTENSSNPISMRRPK